MAAVKAKNTVPEKLVRKIAHRLGYRFRLHRNDLPGKPDLVFPKYRAIVFVNGCYWHGHDCRRGNRVPKTNTDYWTKKIARNKARDLFNSENLAKSGWRILTIWECELSDPSEIEDRLRSFLNRVD